MVSFADGFNALFELLGAFFICFSIRKLLLDRRVRGISWVHVSFFAAWGYWNLYYYWAIGSPWSWYAGVLVTLTNSIYTGMLIYYTRAELKYKEVEEWRI